MTTRKYSLLDKGITHIDYGIRTVFGNPPVTNRPHPAENIEDANLNAKEQQLSARLMRINHAGEVSAQGLYQGQALTAKLPQVREKMQQAALEENDHLLWCEQRCKELDSRTSILSPFWYTGSFTIGALAGLAGDKWSLGFIVETEHQVIKHLDKHLQQISPLDKKTHAILQQMKEDEAHHATTALQAGGEKLPLAVKILMKATSKIMTQTAKYI